ncbi:MAG: hypothetical protein A3C35_07615 [Omnitrophica bacterium RIFCSPHIGHO2_02_FULL_46_11]|nr:MAG: hypothetical protein A3C35_07615 [Omnitrophica bacterium RIFCSPHIGHO2_02_FULL_46_11]OGW86761.1 MAG: hypothetical protein A3A81_08820 [Omnitrophica bacterium RIFCSPLOWO2_01_FULL_45_10b]
MRKEGIILAAFLCSMIGFGTMVLGEEIEKSGRANEEVLRLRTRDEQARRLDELERSLTNLERQMDRLDDRLETLDRDLKDLKRKV